MSVVTYVELPTVPLLLASIAGRSEAKLATRIKLPNEDRVLDFLEAWGFYRALEAWTGIGVDQILSEGSVRRLELRRASEHVNPYYDTMLPRHSLPLTRISIDPERPLYAAARERERWLQGPIQNILKTVIGKQASKFVARAVIFEGIKNTAMHSGADLVYTTAQVERSKEGRGQNEFAVCIWDNGASIARTLQQGYKEFRRITTPLYGRIVEHFTIDVFERGLAAYSYQLTNEHGMPPEIDDELALMISAFFFGVSADPRPRPDDELPDREIGEHVARLAGGGADIYGGFGTYLITDTVAYQCGGSVEYFNGPYHLTITSTGNADQYHVKAEIADRASAGVLGNLLIVRLPGINTPTNPRVSVDD